MFRPISLPNLLLLALVACGGGGGGGNGAAPQRLTGVWFGTNESPNGELTTFELTIDNAEQVVSILIDGVEFSGPGSEVPLFRSTDADIYFDTDPFVAVLVDPTATYAVVVTDAHDFAVVQRGATTRPTYAEGDVAGSFRGKVMDLSLNFRLGNVGAAQLEIRPDGTFTGSDSVSGAISDGAFPIRLDSSVHGLYLGTYSQPGRPVPAQRTGDFVALLSPDRQCLVVYTCFFGYDPDVDTIDGCTFAIYTRDP